jgi:hypothetical protein
MGLHGLQQGYLYLFLPFIKKNLSLDLYNYHKKMYGGKKFYTPRILKLCTR